MFCNLPHDSPVRPRCFRALRRGGGDLGVLPTSYHSRLSFELQDELPTAAGGFADVWKADGPPGVTSALKILRITKGDNFSEIKKVRSFLHGPADRLSCDLQRFCKEVLVAKLVNDGNVLAIDGVQMVDGSKLCIISRWMEHGNMHTYIEGNQDVNRIELVSLGPRSLCPVSDPLRIVTRGDKRARLLTYRWGGPWRPKERKDLIFPACFPSADVETQTNILIDSNRKPRLTDFGLSSVTKNISFNASTERGGGTTRWKAPELLPLSLDVTEWEKAKCARPTEKSDTYSLAMVAIEVLVACLTQILVSNFLNIPRYLRGGTLSHCIATSR